MRRKSVALVMAAATVLSLMAGSGVTALADEETVELTMWGGWAGDQIGQLEKQLEGFNNSRYLHGTGFHGAEAPDRHRFR